MFRRDPLRSGLEQAAALLGHPETVARDWLPLARSVFRRGGVLGLWRQGETVLLPLGGVPRDGVFELASVTKPFTAGLTQALTEQGQLTWETPLRSLGGPLRSLPPHLTPYRLATHTAGLPGHPARAVVTSLTHFHQPYAGMGASAVLASARRWAKAEPQPRFGYSNLGMGVLALALAAVAGEEVSAAGYGVALRRHLTEPLGLRGVYAPGEPWLSGSQVAPYSLLGSHETTDFGELAGAGGLFGTAGDLLRYGQFQLSMRQGAYWQSAIRPAGLVSPRQGVAPGWFHTPAPGRGSAGDTVVWHDGVARGTRTALGFRPRQGSVAVLLVRGGPSPLGARMQVPLLLLHLLGAAGRTPDA